VLCSDLGCASCSCCLWNSPPAGTWSAVTTTAKPILYVCCLAEHGELGAAPAVVCLLLLLAETVWRSSCTQQHGRTLTGIVLCFLISLAALTEAEAVSQTELQQQPVISRGRSCLNICFGGIKGPISVSLCSIRQPHVPHRQFRRHPLIFCLWSPQLLSYACCTHVLSGHFRYAFCTCILQRDDTLRHLLHHLIRS
jgi:hypothetical protein